MKKSKKPDSSQNNILTKNESTKNQDPTEALELPALDLQLIKIDKKLKIFLWGCISLFFIFSFYKISGSSNAYWNDRLPEGASNAKNLFGTSKIIRMDEYCIQTPYTISQSIHGFSTVNETIGGEKAPLLSFVPVKHFISIFKPNMWGYFISDVETGFAWSWNFKTFGILISLTLFFLLITKNKFWISIFGSFWVLYSSGTQWWFAAPIPDLIISSAAVFVSIIYVLFSSNKLKIFLCSTIAVLFTIFFASLLYPPHQIPLAFVMLFIFIGYLIQNRSQINQIKSNLAIKILAGVVSFVCIGLVIFLFYDDAKSTFTVMSNTVYPGQRRVTGGEGYVANIFSEYYKWFSSQNSHPSNWLNICELSHYLNFLPIIVLSLIFSIFRLKRVNYLILIPLIFVLIGIVWIQFGLPDLLSKFTLLNMSPSRRAQIPIGIGGIYITIIYISELNSIKLNLNKKYLISGLLFIIINMAFAYKINLETSNGFFKSQQLLFASIVFLIANICLMVSLNFKYKNHIFAVIIILYLLPNVAVNPLVKGLKGITEHELYKTIQQIEAKDKGHRWLVMNNQDIGYLAQATGVKLLGGVKFLPNMKIMEILDSNRNNYNTYNRYAHTLFSTKINIGSDSIQFKNNFEDAYSVALDPCSPRLAQLDVKYVIFPKEPHPLEIRCMSKIEAGIFYIYKLNNL